MVFGERKISSQIAINDVVVVENDDDDDNNNDNDAKCSRRERGSIKLAPHLN